MTEMLSLGRCAVVLAPLAAFCIVSNSSFRRAQPGPLRQVCTFLVFWLGTGALYAAQFGVGHTWGPLSALGKGVALLVSLTLPMLAAHLVARVLARQGWRPGAAAAAAFAAGALTVPLQPLAGLVLVCVLTGDCP